MGCFWKPSEELLKTKGVIDTVVGYTGNPTASQAPTYEGVCFSREWVEGVRVKYDDAEISYRELLDAFFEAQEPQNSRQYASIIFTHDEEQRQEAQSWLQEGVQAKRVRQRDGAAVSWTTMEPVSAFYQAEGYHQRYWQKQRPRFAIILALLAASSGLFDSFLPFTFAQKLHTAANAVVLLCCAGILMERKLDAKVFKLE
jgi:methionine-S-sulfoxide reductase